MFLCTLYVSQFVPVQFLRNLLKSLFFYRWPVLILYLSKVPGLIELVFPLFIINIAYTTSQKCCFFVLHMYNDLMCES